MVRKAGRSRASLHARKILAILVPIAGLVGWPGRSLASGPGVAVLAAGMIGSQPRLVQLTAATRVGSTAPEGWTHLVMRSVPRLVSGDWRDLPRVANKTATLFRTVILADVQPLGLDKEFILSRVGIAMCVPAPDGKGDDMVVSSDRLQALGMKLSTIEQMVLEAAEAELAESRIIAFTSTFALLRSPVTLVVGGKHQKVDLYYAFCVDPTTGRLRVGVWSMWPGGEKTKQPPPPSVIELAPRTTFDCELDVQAKKVLGLVPFSWSFAIRKLPPGRSIAIKGNKSLGEKIVAITKHPTDVDSGEFERMLRKVLFASRAADAAEKTAKGPTGHRAAAR
jgi:hypothetical protein